MSTLPLVAIAGRTNVGKSTLYNRLVGGRRAIVQDQPGVTRDRRYGTVSWVGREFRIVDTGGLEPEARQGIEVGITRQAQRALEEAAVVVFVTDATTGPTGVDRQIARTLRKLGKPIIWVANKVDGPKQEAAAHALYELGASEVLPVSAEHGRGVGDLLDRLLELLPAPDPAADAEAADAIRMAFVGKPNAGKSSLVNAILGEDRVLVHEVPGTTRDPVDTPFSYGGKRYVLVDTAGIRKHKTGFDLAEYVSVTMAKRALERADVVLIVIDAALGASEQDARIARMVEDGGRAAVLVLNKVDRLKKREREAARAKLGEEVEFMGWAEAVECSALEGTHVDRVLEAAAAAVEQHRRRVPTAELNRIFEQILDRHPPPGWRGKAIRLYYVTQVDVRPPTFVVQANHPEGVSPAYRKFLVKRLREEFAFRGTPLRLVVRARQRKKRGERDDEET